MEIVTGFYDSMHFVREGGGQIEFTLSPSDSSDIFNVVVTKLGARDSTIQILVEINDENRSALALLDKAMNQQVKINGDFKQSNLLAGTWAFIYMLSDKKKIEVTNTELRNSILQLEQLVRDKNQ